MARAGSDREGTPQECDRGTGQAEPAPADFGELVAYLRRRGARLVEAWARSIADSRLLTAVSQDQIHTELVAVYRGYVEALEAGTSEALRAFARDLSDHLVAWGVQIHEVIGIVLLLRDVVGRSLFDGRRSGLARPDAILDAYERAAGRIAYTVAIDLVRARERLIGEQQEAIRELLEVAAARESGAYAYPARRELHAPGGTEP